MSSTRGSHSSDTTGCVFNIERFATRDGPGIRTTVFLKGCALRCLWCANPESINPVPQLMYFEHLCQRCYKCVAVCPTRATTVGATGEIKIDRGLCKACGDCVEACIPKAREITGQIMTVGQVIDEVKKDTLFYQNSGGGVTASGGEPTHQPEFLRSLFENCQQAAIHTCLDTTGFVQREVLERILEHTDLVLYDIKHMNPVRHKELAGVDNTLILENARMIAARGKPVIIRVPLVPEHNDSEENLEALAEFMSEQVLTRVDLLPYHSLGKAKYERLGIEYRLADLQPHSAEQIERMKGFLESYGLEVGVG